MGRRKHAAFEKMVKQQVCDLGKCGSEFGVFVKLRMDTFLLKGFAPIGSLRGDHCGPDDLVRGADDLVRGPDDGQHGWVRWRQLSVRLRSAASKRRSFAWRLWRQPRRLECRKRRILILSIMGWAIRSCRVHVGEECDILCTFFVGLLCEVLIILACYTYRLDPSGSACRPCRPCPATRRR